MLPKRADVEKKFRPSASGFSLSVSFIRGIPINPLNTECFLAYCLITTVKHVGILQSLYCSFCAMTLYFSFFN
jgi:hypothetical protein